MCGIVGYLDLVGLKADALMPRLARAVERLGKRGPDGSGVWRDERCAFGHTRLAIIDLSASANQPMTGHGLTITFNGEIYNYREVRDELRALGHVFVTNSDTEVLLAGWRAWGAGMLPRLSGMFALALWDAAKGELILARDRFGKKPLLYAHEGARLAFSSELTALEEVEGRKRPIDQAALRLLFALRYVPDPWTIADGVRKLPAGHLARVTASGVGVERWYDLAAQRPTRFTSEANASAALRVAFDAAVMDRTVADVPIGAFLSSGIDSALVVASLARQAGTPRTFTVGFPGASDYYEERPGAASVARFLGCDHTEVDIGPSEARGALDNVIDGLDEPFADSSALPTYLLSAVTRRHVTVALSGDGADEVFGGYRKYQGELLAERYRAIPIPLRRGVIEPLAALLPEGKDNAVLERLRRLRRFVAHAGGAPAERQAGWARLLSESELNALLIPYSNAPTVETLVDAARSDARETDPINEMLAAEIAIGLVGDMLVKVDRMSMANGLEVRCPFLDPRVVECAAAMPGEFKLAPGAGKRILRRAFADRLPEDVFRRPKKGFEMPIASWLAGPLAERVRAAIDPAHLTRQGLFRPDLPARWFADLRAGKRDTSWQLWTMLVFQSWCETRGRSGALA
ncbi:MAG: asparagine synthase (glutamine-hydrolyzing) [Alphaproteobacteria bacterium]|nr:asparagine synthase (glutamine-hydrolyzing) [Alphaproteobacteria bacterium]